MTVNINHAQNIFSRINKHSNQTERWTCSQNVANAAKSQSIKSWRIKDFLERKMKMTF